MDTIKELLIVLEVTNGRGVLRRSKVNFADSLQRQFIAKTAWWAMTNGLTMTTRPLIAGEVVDEIRIPYLNNHKHTMKTATSVLFLLFLFLFPACSSLDIDGARLSAGYQQVTAAARVETQLGSYTDSATDSAPVGRVELVNDIGDGAQVGLLLGGSEGSISAIDFYSVDIGATLRQFIGDGSIRPYGEMSVGYRRFGVSDSEFGDGSSDMIFGSAAVGLDFGIGDRLSIFAQAGYGGAYSDDFSTYGPEAMFGLSVRF